MPSWITGTVSVQTGNDSVPTAAGVCPPFPDEMIKDGASFPTGGTDSVLTATTPPDCDVEPTPWEEDGFFWVKSYGGTDQFIKDGSNRVSKWINQFPPDIDPEAVNDTGVPLPNVERPVWTSVVPGASRSMFRWNKTAGPVTSVGTNLNKIYPPSTLNEPTADGAPVTFYAVVMFLDSAGGNVVTLRLNNADCEMGYRRYDNAESIPISSAQDGHAYFTPRIDYSNQLILLKWEYNGGSPASAPKFYVNGVQIAMSSSQLIQNYTGISGMTIGHCNASGNESPDAYFGEILGYRGILTDGSPGDLQTVAYLVNQWPDLVLP